MNTVAFHIVGLPYHEVGSDLSNFLEEARGKTMTLRAEHDNEVDQWAVVAYDWQCRRVGYVKSGERAKAHGVLHAVGKAQVRTRVSAVDMEHKCVTVECISQDVVDAHLSIAAGEYERWAYDGPVMVTPAEWRRLDCMADTLDDLLDMATEWTDDDQEEFTTVLSRFASSSAMDISREMTLRRRHLVTRIRTLDCGDWAESEGLLERMESITGRELVENGQVWKEWMHMLSDDKCCASMAAHGEAVDVSALEKSLWAFPGGLYAHWRSDRRHFPARLYYASVPREVLWRFVSGIVMMEVVSASHDGLRLIFGWADRVQTMDDDALESFRRVLEYLNLDTNKDLSAPLRVVNEELSRRTVLRYAPHKINVAGNYIEAHDNQAVNCVPQ